MTLPKLTFSALVLSSSLLGFQPSAPLSEMGTVAAQLASVRQQLMSVEVQRQSIAKQEAALYGMPKQAAFLELPRSEPQYVDCGALPRRETDKLIATAARTQSISADLLRAVIRQESAFRPCAVSDKGAQGLMQLMPATAAAFNVSDPFDPQQNILGGAAYLRQLMERYAGDASLALSAYNAGPQRVDRIAGIPDIPETQNYVTSIFRDLGWTLPIRPVTLPETGFGQTETDSDVTIEAIAPDVSISELGPEQSPANPIQAKVPLPFFRLP